VAEQKRRENPYMRTYGDAARMLKK